MVERTLRVAAVCIVTFLAVAGSAWAEVETIRIDRTEPFANGQAFGSAGAYVRQIGVVRGSLDPDDPRNAVIVNLHRAPRNARGRVEYEADIFILRPADLAKGNRRLLYEVNNRGRKFLMHWINEARPTAPGSVNDPKSASDAGNGWLMRQGYIMVWSGWDPDAPTRNSGMAIRVPVAVQDGKAVTQRVRHEIVAGTRGPAEVVRARLGYPAASLDQGRARLTVRSYERDARVEIPRDRWAFVDKWAIKLLPEGTRFEQGKIYDFWYEAAGAKVLGIGFAATRDVVSFLRYETRDRSGTPNPVAESAGRTGIRAALAVGISQSGRYLRHHVELGMNQDTRGRKVFDGVLAHISGVGKVFHNHAFGQPGRTSTQHQDHSFPENWFPFAHGRQTDPLTGQTAGLLRGDGFDPLIIETNTPTEYWQKGASLLHTDPTGARDVPPPRGVRLYMIAGTQHGGRAGLSSAPGPCANPRNPHNPSAALRALIKALDEWSTEGKAPPPSRVPTIAAGTLVPADRIGFPAIPGAKVAAATNRLRPPVDWADPPASASLSPSWAYGTLVPKVDSDGNETSGIRLPPIAVPIASYTGWNLYKRPFAEGALCDRFGSFLAFARAKAERERAGDPRSSLEERYGNRAGYVARVKAAAERLVAERLLFSEDVRPFVEWAEKNSPLGGP